MTPPIRPGIFEVTRFEVEPEEMKLRDAVDWFKKVTRGSETYGVLTPLEQNHINGQYGVMCKGVAKTQGVPAGMLSYFVGELAQTELKLMDVATEEAAVAQAYTGQQTLDV